MGAAFAPITTPRGHVRELDVEAQDAANPVPNKRISPSQTSCARLQLSLVEKIACNKKMSAENEPRASTMSPLVFEKDVFGLVDLCGEQGGAALVGVDSGKH